MPGHDTAALTEMFDLSATILTEHKRRTKEYERRLECLLTMLHAVHEEGCALGLGSVDDEEWGMGIGGCAGSIEKALEEHRSIVQKGSR